MNIIMESPQSTTNHLRQKHHTSRGSSQGSRGSHRKHGGMLWSVKSVCRLMRMPASKDHRDVRKLQCSVTFLSAADNCSFNSAASVSRSASTYWTTTRANCDALEASG